MYIQVEKTKDEVVMACFIALNQLFVTNKWYFSAIAVFQYGEYLMKSKEKSLCRMIAVPLFSFVLNRFVSAMNRE